MLKTVKNNFRNIYHKGYAALDKNLGYPFERNKFFQTHGYKLNLDNPKTFSEKLVWKKINDRNSLLPITADKYRVRAYLKEVLGEYEANKILIPLLYSTDSPEEIPFDQLPAKYIIKSNFGSGQNLIVDGSAKLSREKIVSICKEWLKKPHGIKSHEWAYKEIAGKIIIEKLLIDEDENIPKDYKFFVFNGSCHLIQVNTDGLQKHRRIFYSPDWIEVQAKYSKVEQADKESKPLTLKRMLELAEIIGKGYDFVRVDLYTVSDKVYFGEMTHYPLSGRGKLSPKSFDDKLGDIWKLEK